MLGQLTGFEVLRGTTGAADTNLRMRGRMTDFWLFNKALNATDRSLIRDYTSGRYGF